MKNKLTVLALMLGAAGLATSAAHAQEKVKIGFITKFPVPFFATMEGAAKEFAAANPDVEIIFGQGTSATDIEGQIALIESMVTKGVQGIAIAERAYQKAVQYARDRVQSRPVDGSIAASAPIIHHPDVKRMLMTMRAYTEGCRAMALTAAAAYDASHHHADKDVRAQNQAFYEFLVPLVKGYSTEMSLEVTSLGVQVHGGMGFIEETGAAQYYRDAKILTIYEGTTAIQANDLVGRKTARDGGQTAKAIAAQIEATEAELMRNGSGDAEAVAKRLRAARRAFLDVVDFVAGNSKASPNAVYAGSVTYLLLAGNLVAGWQLGRALLIAQEQIAEGKDVDFMKAKIATARFYADHILSRVPGQRDSVVDGADSVTALALEAF